jgi:hypothetical protein
MQAYKRPKKGPRIQGSHEQNWIEAIQGKAQCTSPFDYAGPFTETVALGNVGAMFPGQKLLWDGKALARGYRSTGGRLERWLANARHLGLEDAARESFLLGDEAIRQLVFDPLLPPPLVDEQARADFVDTVIRFDAAGQAIWRDFLNDSPATRRRPAPRAAVRTALEARR